MNIVKANVFERVQEPGLEGIYKEIEFASRVCTHTTDKMSDNSEEWVKEHIIKRGHFRALEFGTVYLKMPYFSTKYEWMSNNPWTVVNVIDKDDSIDAYVTTNYRVLYEANLLDLLAFAEDRTEQKPRRTLVWEVSRGIADELRTHVSISTLMESTRYCRYSADKFGGELTFVEPTWMEKDYSSSFMIENWQRTEESYLAMLNAGLKAEQAREVLPLGIKTTLVQCGFECDWKHLFELRAKITESNKPHPDMIAIASKAENVLFHNSEHSFSEKDIPLKQ